MTSDYKAAVYKLVLKNGGAKEFEEILKSFYATEDNVEKSFAYNIGSALDASLKARVLDWAVKSGDVIIFYYFD